MIKDGHNDGVPSSLKFKGWQAIVRKHMRLNFMLPIDFHEEDFMDRARRDHKDVHREVLMELYEKCPDRGGKL